MADVIVEVIQGKQRSEHELRAPSATLGVAGSDVPIAGASGQLRVDCEPPRLEWVSGAKPTVAGQEVAGIQLDDASVVDWGGARLLFRVQEPVLEEITPPAAAAPAAAPAADPQLVRGYERLAAGMLVELKLAEPKTAKRWQQAVLAGEWDADACAQEILSASGVEPGDSRLVERAGRLQRDLLMIRYQTGARGAGRKARKAARGGAAFLLSQVVAIGVYTLILLAIIFLLRVKNDFSLDGVIDSVLDFISSGR